MPNLVPAGLSIRDVSARRVTFRKVRIGQVFYSNYRWYQRRSPNTAWRADVTEKEIVHFKRSAMVRVFDEHVPTTRRIQGLSFAEFINQSAL